MPFKCPYCIDAYNNEAFGKGWSEAQIVEAVHVARVQNISWSTKEALNQTIAICEGLKLLLHLLPELSDIDNEDDFKKVEEQLLLIKEGEV